MTPSLLRRRHLLASPQAQRELLQSIPLTRSFEASLGETGLQPLRPTQLDILQINIGRVCNQTCRHCHVDAGPDRGETMPAPVVEECLRVFEGNPFSLLDITGGAPELHPMFREIVRRARATGRRVMDRCNLTILGASGQEGLAEFLAEQRVEVTASLPYYLEKQTDAQRGAGVFQQSIKALQTLNTFGFGKPGTGLILNIVTNPTGSYLPGNQTALDRDWKRELSRRHGIEFSSLFTITNMPVSRFLEYLCDSGNLEGYLEKLVNAYNPAAAAGVMCRNTLNVGYDGVLYDCDFNQMLAVPIAGDGGAPLTIFDCQMAALESRSIRTGPHCFGCTAGSGSGCGGATLK